MFNKNNTMNLSQKMNKEAEEVTSTDYLAGHINDKWSEELMKQTKDKGLSIDFVYPQTEHNLSDDIGEKILGKQPGDYYRDEAASAINNFRTTVLMEKADMVVALFGDQYRQWNTAMDATTAINKGKPLIIIRPKNLIHALKALSNIDHVTIEKIEQAVEVLEYINQQNMMT